MSYVLTLFLHTVEVLLEEFETGFPVIPLQPYPSWKANASQTNYTCDMMPGGNGSEITWNKINFVRLFFACFVFLPKITFTDFLPDSFSVVLFYHYLCLLSIIVIHLFTVDRIIASRVSEKRQAQGITENNTAQKMKCSIKDFLS